LQKHVTKEETMLEYGLARPEEEQALLDFGNYVFSMSHEPTDFRVLQPRIYGRPGFSKITQVAREEGRILGMVSAITGSLMAGGESLRYGYVGTVAAHPYHRGRGIMKRLMADTLNSLRQQGCDVAVLGGQRQRYQHFGFEDAGGKLAMYLSQGSMAHVLGPGKKDRFRFLPLEENSGEDLQRLHRLHQSQTLVCSRPLADFPLILRTWGGSAYRIYEGDSLAGYCYVLGGDVKEFALFDRELAPEVFQALLNTLQRTGMQVTLRPFELADHARLFACADSWEMSPALMVSVFNWQAFLQTLLRFKASLQPLAAGQRVLDIAGTGAYEITVTDKIVSVRETGLEADLALDPLAALRLTTLPLSQSLHPQHPFFNWFPLPFDIPSADAF